MAFSAVSASGVTVSDGGSGSLTAVVDFHPGTTGDTLTITAANSYTI